MVERFNTTVLDYLAKFVDRNQRNWDLLLPLSLLAYRSAEHEASKYTVVMLNFGRELRLPADLMFLNPNKQSASNYIYDLRTKLEEVHHMARQHLRLPLKQLRSGMI
ncbi:hypothetical protein CVS40_6853 [Lucilia cuprina]|nr:hypothetical protein CVS40_6853 [Lucilia cuprina]